jgi:hypothetical protein
MQAVIIQPLNSPAPRVKPWPFWKKRRISELFRCSGAKPAARFSFIQERVEFAAEEVLAI